MARQTKQQKAEAAQAQTAALAGHYQAVTPITTDTIAAPEFSVVEPSPGDPDIGDAILDGIDRAIKDRRDRLMIEAATVLTAIDDGVLVAITGDSVDGFVGGVKSDVPRLLLDEGLVKPNHAMLFGRSLYHLELTEAGHDWLKSHD